MAEQRVIRFTQVARRLGAAAGAAGLVVPAFRTPPRGAALRTIRRLPGGPVVAVRITDRAFGEVVADLVEGVIVANGLEGDAALRMRTRLARAAAAAEPARAA